MKGRWTATLCSILIIMILAACGSNNEKAAHGEDSTSAVQVITVKKEPLSTLYNLSGTLRPNQEASISFQTAGEIQKTLVEEGDKVKAGQVLAVVDNANAQLQLRQAQSGVKQAAGQLSAAKAGVAAAEAQVDAAAAQLETAEANLATLKKGASAQKLAQAQNAVTQAQNAYDKLKTDADRYLNLYSNGLISLDEYEKFQVQFKDAETALDNAKQSLSELTEGATPEQSRTANAAVSQAKAGKVSAEAAVSQARGSLAQAQAAYDQAVAKQQQAELALSQTQLIAPVGGVILEKKAVVGQTVSAGAEGFMIGSIDTLKVTIPVPSDQASAWKAGQSITLEQNGVALQGTVNRISPVTNQGTGTISVEVNVPNPKHDWIPGQVVRAGRSVSEQEGIFVPVGAVISNGQEPYVFRYINGKAVKTVVKLGAHLSEDNRQSIVSGLKEGDVVVSSGAESLFDGDAIAILEENVK